MKSKIAARDPRRLRRGLLCLSIGLLLSGAALSVFAQDAAAPSPNATVNLIRLMVKRGLITQADADGLLAQANTEAAQARSAVSAAPPSDGAQPGDVRVAYVPESVRNEIRDQVKQEVVAQAKTEHWATPNAIPEWLDRISWYGDVHVRDESWFYSRNNSPYFIDYGAFNRNGPFDINSITQGANPPILNSQQDRLNMLRLQAHLGVAVKLGDTVTAGVRIGSGSDDNPVSTTQTLGGGLTKKDLWLDQAWIRWQPTDWGSLTAGRMAQPFVVSDLIYSTELNFDGVAGHFDLPFTDSLNSFATVGAFPIEYTSSDSPSEAFGYDKNVSNEKWMTAAQIGATWKIDNDTQFKSALAYYYFDHMRGELSSPCALYTGINYCSTDDTAPQYMQKGNTVFLIRDIIPDPSSPSNYAQPQFVGLSYNYHVADFYNQLDFKLGETSVRLQADYARNMAYHESDALNRYPGGLGQPINNYQSGATATTQGPYKSGPVAWLVRGIVGTPHPMEANEWNIALGYKYVQPDSMLDGLTDANFDLGGTNNKGFIFTADYGIAPRTWLSARYYDAKQVYGPPLAIDVLQIELSTKF
jgi:hypothetical protein